jgi:predicted metal-dependent hydrolase
MRLFEPRPPHFLTDSLGAPVPLEMVRHSRARRMTLRYDAARGVVRLTLPPRAGLRPALAWASGQGEWLTRQRTRQIEGPAALGDGATVPFRGELLFIHHDPAAGRQVRHESGTLIVGGPADRVGARVIRWLRAQALELLTAETRALADTHGLGLTAVAIGDPRSRWGSCTSRGAIRYSWRLVMAPDFVRQATVAHEVAHLQHMDHSPAFHAFLRAISSADPDAARAWLRREGAGLHRYSN